MWVRDCKLSTVLLSKNDIDKAKAYKLSVVILCYTLYWKSYCTLFLITIIHSREWVSCSTRAPSNASFTPLTSSFSVFISFSFRGLPVNVENSTFFSPQEKIIQRLREAPLICASFPSRPRDAILWTLTSGVINNTTPQLSFYRIKLPFVYLFINLHG